jgi:hypothetical protein
MTQPREFTSTQLLISAGFIFVDRELPHAPKIGFLRRVQPEIHHGPQMPLTMATVGGMFQPLHEVDTDGTINTEGFKGRPMSVFECAQMHAQNKLGIWMSPKHAANYNWHVIDHPYYYGERTPDVRNVGKVMRQVYDITGAVNGLRAGLARVNLKKPEEEKSKLLWFEQIGFQLALQENHSLKEGEVTYLEKLYVGLIHGVNLPPPAEFELT